MKNDFLYQEISNNIASLIRNEVLKAGDRLPSVRLLCQEHGISMNTAKSGIPGTGGAIPHRIKATIRLFCKQVILSTASASGSKQAFTRE